ncbi:exodeoxyribonuclease V subunit alpha [Alginatibacterium sediminis]|uniref:RecBCD enzyme subunit RecD n=1 Tax=Alginatibacterium sediminis TaxID=2164068 RepID=A0A420ELM5_9ALTE|nr:exodeoxyribonuclease V subunit alpha [Alginatibacterium sediminis]RKF21516.1 exodeoxyribonuclease V subunit alpha [Alginatibacterium sediminis]
MLNHIDTASALGWLNHCLSHERLDELDFHFAKFLHEHGANNASVIAAALLSSELANGNSCLEIAHIKFKLSRLQQQTDLAIDFDLPEAHHDWISELELASVVGEQRPLVLEFDRLYLNRYWQFERSVAQRFSAPALKISPEPNLVRSGIDSLFAHDWSFQWQIFSQTSPERRAYYVEHYLDLQNAWVDANPQIMNELAAIESPTQLETWYKTLPELAVLNWQKVAVAQACRQQLLVISGGPGTGKTTTVTRLLALLQQLQIEQGLSPLKIAMVAPTGKAAARLSESISGARGQLNASAQVVSAIPEQATTIHRLLGVRAGRQQFIHHVDNPLALDLLVVDEASMIDLSLMAKLLDALDSSTRIILLGDKDQLASVEAGSVMADLCSFAQQPKSQDLLAYLAVATGSCFDGLAQGPTRAINDNLALLHKSYRFDASSGIGQLAASVNRADVVSSKQQFARGFADIDWHQLDQNSYQTALDQAQDHYRDYLEALQQGADMLDVFKRFNQFQLLLALREGDFGVEGFNQRIQQRFAKMGLLGEQQGWSAGLPIMVLANDHEQQLYNGDIGIFALNEQGRLMVVFENAKQLRWILPSRLPSHQVVFAMTVHKSQGSEYQSVSLLLPPQGKAQVSRELLYTGITRAKQHFTLYADDLSFTKAVEQGTERFSGLTLRL